MSVLDRARQAAAQAAEQARHSAQPSGGSWGSAGPADATEGVPAAMGPGTPEEAPEAGSATPMDPTTATWGEGAATDPATAGWGRGPASAPQPMDWSQVGSQMRGVASKAKSGLVSVLDKIDPGVLADVIVRATAIQEGANRSLRERGSTYRIGEITITATIPPQIGFSIQRMGDLDGDGVPDVVEDHATTA